MATLENVPLLEEDEDTVELTVMSALFKKEAKYFIGVRMVGHAGKVKTELSPITTRPQFKNGTFAFALPTRKLSGNTDLTVRFGAFVAMPNADGQLMPPKLLGQVDFDIHSMSTRLVRGETVFEKLDIERRIEAADGSVRRLIVGRVSFMLHLIGVGDGVVAGVGEADACTLDVIAHRAAQLPLRPPGIGGMRRPPDAVIECRLVPPPSHQVLQDCDNIKFGPPAAMPPNLSAQYLQGMEQVARSVTPRAAAETRISINSCNPTWNEIMNLSVLENMVDAGYLLRIDAIDTGQASKDDEESMGVIIASASIPLNELQTNHDYNIALQCPRRARHSGMEDPTVPGGGSSHIALDQSANLEGGDGDTKEKYSTMYTTVTLRSSVQQDLSFFTNNDEFGKRVSVYIEAMSTPLNISPQPFDVVIVTHLVSAKHVAGYEASLKSANSADMPPMPMTRFVTIPELTPNDTFAKNKKDHSMMQSLLKISPAAVWNKHRRPRWEYSVNFDVGQEHPGFGHYPDKNDDLGLVFMMFAKPDAGYNSKHELMAYGVIMVPPEAPCDGRSITFAGIPIQMVGNTFKQAPLGDDYIPEVLEGVDPNVDPNQLLLRVRLKVWKSKSYAKYLLDGENGAPPDLSSGAINWIGAASKLVHGHSNSLGSAVLSAQTAEANTGDAEAVRDEAKRRYEKRRKGDDDKRKEVENEANAISEKWKQKRMGDEESNKKKEEDLLKQKKEAEEKVKKEAEEKAKKEAEEERKRKEDEKKLKKDELDKKRKIEAEAKKKKEEARKKKEAEEKAQKEKLDAARKKKEEEQRQLKEKKDKAATKIQSKQRANVAKKELARKKALLEAQKAKYAARYKKKLEALQTALNEYRSICDVNLKDAEKRESEQEELKAMTSASNILVAARFRPLMGRELKLGTGKVSDELKIPEKEGQEVDFRENVFTMDYVFGMKSSQDIIYKPAQAMVGSFTKGFNSTIFAYGQTGSGKTWTMFGDVNSEENMGIVSRSCAQVFSYMKETKEKDGINTELKVSMIEIYNEQINDLLNKAGKNLQLREDIDQGVYIPTLREIKCDNIAGVVKILNQGFAGRATSSTKMNDESSRSHCLVQLRLDQTKDGGNYKKSSRLNLVDLAGSEKVKKTGAKGSALKEAQSINTSLSALGKIIRMLSDSQMKDSKKKKSTEEEAKTSGNSKKNRRKTAAPSKEKHIPYRDSKLTRLLQHSLGGNTKTMLLVACSPHDDNFEETLSTLRFASRARMISNITSVNATSTNLDGFKATGTTAPELREQLQVRDLC